MSEHDADQRQDLAEEMRRLASPVFDWPSRPVRRAEARLLVDRATGEVLGWEGLNDDPERCPLGACGMCEGHCVCAPCRCAECCAREAWTKRPLPNAGNRPQLVLL